MGALILNKYNTRKHVQCTAKYLLAVLFKSHAVLSLSLINLLVVMSLDDGSIDISKNKVHFQGSDDSFDVVGGGEDEP